jgi:hypothetical protein
MMYSVVKNKKPVAIQPSAHTEAGIQLFEPLEDAAVNRWGGQD